MGVARWVFAAALAGLVLLGCAASALADELRDLAQLTIDDLHPGVGERRVVEAYVRALTRYGEPVEDLSALGLEVREDGRRIDPGKVEVRPLRDAGLGTTCVLAIDTGSGAAALDDLRAAALLLIDELDEADRVAVVAFSAQGVEVAADFDASRAGLREALARLAPAQEPGPSLLHDAVHRGIDLIRSRNDLPRYSILIVTSDGRDKGSSATLDAIFEASRGSTDQPHILVHAIGRPPLIQSGLEALRQLASETGGDFVIAPAPVHLASLLLGFGRQTARAHVLRFDSEMDGELHAVEVSAGTLRDSRSTTYPEIAGFSWPASAGFGLLALLGAVWLLLHRRGPGRLVFVSGLRAGEQVKLVRGRLRIGALPENDVVIPSPTVSRFHAEIRFESGRVEIEDLQSRNGTLVNGERIERRPLRRGDCIRIADVDMVYRR